MHDRHPTGAAVPPAPAPDPTSVPCASYGPQGGPYGERAAYADSTATYPAAPRFDGLPGDGGTGSYDTGQWPAGSYGTLGTGAPPPPDHDPYATQHHAVCDTGAHDTASWPAGPQQPAAVPAQPSAPDTTGQWGAPAWHEANGSAVLTQQWEWGTQTFDTGPHDATQWSSVDGPRHGAEQAATDGFEPVIPKPFDDTGRFDDAEPLGQQAAGDAPPKAAGGLPVLDGRETLTPAPASRAACRAARRSRRRTPAKRSALLTVAVPSVCVMGVAGIAAATVGGGGEDGKHSTASAATPVKPSAAHHTLDSQLANLSPGANGYADRASRTQERIDLKAQQAAEKKKAAAEAALKERLRPKFVLPVLQKGLSAYFGQAGVNWMSVHTGIDFPVAYGTTVMAATDGTVQTKWNSAYGNMLILTAKDGTQTWYCHLSGYRVPFGATVKAGQPIAYSGNSGNSTGPHLHFEVRPSGGAAIDPLPWLRSHGLDPT